jgi:hypothetical protein
MRDISFLSRLILLSILFLISTALYRWWKFREWRSWPCVEGTVDAAEVREDRVLKGPVYYVGVLHYSYQVTGVRYSGVFERDFREPRDAHEFANAMKSGSVAVHYHPTMTDRSRLEIYVARSFARALGRWEN